MPKPMEAWSGVNEEWTSASVCVATLSNGKQIGYLMKPWNPTIVIKVGQCGGAFSLKSHVMERTGYAELSKGDKGKVTRTYNLFLKYLTQANLPPPPVEG